MNEAYVWVRPGDIESPEDVEEIDGRTHLVLRDGTCAPLLRRCFAFEDLPDDTEVLVLAPQRKQRLAAPSLRDRITELAIIWDRESIEPAEDLANAVMGLLADADPTDLGLERVGWLAADPASTAGYDLYVCTREEGDEPVYARPRTEEAHTVDVGPVHVLTEDGACTPTCPHPNHRTEEP